MDDVGALLGGDGGHDGLGAGGDDDAVKVLGGGQDVLGGGLLVEDYLNAQGAALALEPLAEIADVIAPRGRGGVEGEAQGAVALFPDGDLVAAQGADAGELHAGGAGADDEDALRVLALDLGGELALGVAQRGLAVALVVADAADFLAGLGGVEAEGVAADAGADAVILAAHGLVHELGIASH